MQRTWISTYPAYFVQVLDYNVVEFILDLGFNISIKQQINIDINMAPDNTRVVFLKRRIENILHSAKRITIDIYWSNQNQTDHCADIDVDNRDLIEMLYASGALVDEK